MDESMVIDLAISAMTTILWTSLPVLIIALVVGLIISIFQTVTSIQESTLAFAPKIIAVFLGIILFGPFMLNRVMEYTINLYTSFNLYVK